MDSDDTIWFDDIHNFFTVPERLTKLYWSSGDSNESRLNVMVRFALYYGVTLGLMLGKTWPLTIPVYIALFTYLVHRYRMMPDDTSVSTLKSSGSTPKTGKKVITQQRTMPTIHNPAMNFRVYDDVDRPAAANVLDCDVQSKMSETYNSGIPHDNKDLWGRNSGQRHLYTMPCTKAVNDADAFARALFKPTKQTDWKEQGVLFHGN